ncbi:hypothetical protein J3R83DRAFT_12550 [Lanmaoa asiatica]|nr:hypothetical protein J3R83DRAFT_12550 [Lanmaoa asiatica]
MFWSYIPLAAFGIIAAAFAVKMPIEVCFRFPTWLPALTSDSWKIQEDMIQRDEGMKEEYGAYKKRVPARVIPYIW